MNQGHLGRRRGTTTAEAARLAELEQENPGPAPANGMLGRHRYLGPSSMVDPGSSRLHRRARGGGAPMPCDDLTPHHRQAVVQPGLDPVVMGHASRVAVGAVRSDGFTTAPGQRPPPRSAAPSCVPLDPPRGAAGAAGTLVIRTFGGGPCDWRATILYRNPELRALVRNTGRDPRGQHPPGHHWRFAQLCTTCEAVALSMAISMSPVVASESPHLE